MRPAPKTPINWSKITNNAVFYRPGSWKREGYHCSRAGSGQELRESIPRELHLSSLCWTWETGMKHSYVLNGRRSSSERRWLSLTVTSLNRMQRWSWTALLSAIPPSSSLEMSLGNQIDKIWYCRATTHSDLWIRAKERNIPVTVIHNASIMNACACCGLQLYSFGQTVSLCFFTETWRPDSFYEKIEQNFNMKLHTLCLLGTWFATCFVMK